MENSLLFIIIGCSAVAGVLVLAFLIYYITYQQRIRSLYRGSYRDERFAGALLTMIFGEQIIRKPYVLRDDSVQSPRVDALFVCSGGIAVISVQKGGGLYSAPEKGTWRVIEDGEIKVIDNLLEKQQAYISEISATLIKNSLRCPTIRGYVFLTDDSAEINYISSDSVLTGSRLIEELKTFESKNPLKSKEQKAILAALRKNHANISQTFKFRSQRDFAVSESKKEAVQDPLEDFDLSDLILVNTDHSEYASKAESSITTQFRVLTERADSDDNSGESGDQA